MISTLQEKTKAKTRPQVKKDSRIKSVDILRGAVMVIMALDHVRHFVHQPAMIDEPTNLATTTPVLFFTRWITHFCAPVFIFLSGMSAYISGQNKTKAELSAFLIKRGLWLVVVELVIMTFSITFNPFFNLFFLQVIWAIGCSMIILGLLVRTSMAIIIATGVIIFLGHNLLDYVHLPSQGSASVLLSIFLTSSGKVFAVDATRSFAVLYAILPWTAIMIGGFVFGHFYRSGENQMSRRRNLLIGGITLSIVFVLLRLLNGYGDPAPWSAQKDAVYGLLSFLNVTKYPVSLQYACMTLGPALIVLAVTEKLKSKFANTLVMFGRVPFFFYVCHFYLIHIIGVALFFASGHGWNEVVDKGSFIFFRPLNFGFALPVVYLVWILVIFVLYWPCKWFSKYKKTHQQWWLSYV